VDTCHGSCLVEVDGVGLEGGFVFRLIWILVERECACWKRGLTDPAVDLELLEQGLFLCRHCLRRGGRGGKCAQRGACGRGGAGEDALHGWTRTSAVCRMNSDRLPHPEFAVANHDGANYLDYYGAR
jgi:hypothetical protein